MRDTTIAKAWSVLQREHQWQSLPMDPAKTSREHLLAQKWQPSRARTCPMWVANRRCTGDTGNCICTRNEAVLDHSSVWTVGDTRVLVAQPFVAELSDLTALQADLERIGLRAALRGYSPYWPGQTMAVLITPDSHQGTLLGARHKENHDR